MVNGRKVLFFALLGAALFCFLFVAVLTNSSLTGNFLLEPDVYSGADYAPPYNVLEDDLSVFNATPDYIELTSGQDFVGLDLNVSMDGGVVYKKGYIYDFQARAWLPFDFDQDTISASYWISDFASTRLEMNSSQFLREGYNYVVAYACKKYDGEWKCGCNSGDDCNHWMLQVVNLSGVPLPANNSCSDEFDCIVNESCVDGECVDGGAVPREPGEDDIPISNCQELQNMRNNLTANYYLTQDVNCSETRTWNWNAGLGDYRGFVPIGYSMPPNDNSHLFWGSFDGRGYKIYNLYSNSLFDGSAKEISGLFGETGGQLVLSNVGLINSSITGFYYVGGLVGYMGGGVISNCYIENGSVIGSHYVGGLVGYVPSYGVINNSYFVGNVTPGDTYSAAIGGLAGSSSGVIDNVYTVVNISGGNNVGGLVGGNDGVLKNAFSVVNVLSSGEFIRALVGSHYDSSFNNLVVLNNSGLSCFFNGNGGCTRINDLNYFYNKSNAPMSSWDFVNVWKENVDGFPTLK